MDLHAGRHPSVGRAASCMENDPASTRTARQTTSHATATTSRGRASRQQHSSTTEQMPVTDTCDALLNLSNNSSKSSPPYTSSQRKQLRVQEKFYLKEVKKSIAEGRVPQVRLQQNNSGDIAQYKPQFLNALKLAALAIVPHADIDIKDHSTMSEIMEEVKRQFIIEKPLPEGMVGGFLQRLYKRNRAMYRSHWTVHGDHSKPDECPSAAWVQLVDYWKSAEGSKECTKNKANASAKKVHKYVSPPSNPSVTISLNKPHDVHHRAVEALTQRCSILVCHSLVSTNASVHRLSFPYPPCLCGHVGEAQNCDPSEEQDKRTRR